MKTVKHLSVLLAVLLVVSLLVVGFVVNADEPAAITVTNEAEFAAAMVEANAAATIELANDITLTNGNTTMPGTFTGTFDGNGYKLSGVTNTLFNKLSGATITDVVVEGAITSENRKAATIAYDEENNSVIKNVTSYVDITMTAADLNAGGIIGYGKSVTFENVTYAGDYVATWTSAGCGVGGIIGYTNNNGTANYINCAFTGTMTVKGEGNGTLDVGGVIGIARNGKNNFENFVNLGTITIEATATNNNISAIAGRNRDNSATINIKNCINLGTASEGVTLADAVANGNATSIEGVFNATHVDGDPVEVEGVTYQKYTNEGANIYLTEGNAIVTELPEPLPSFTEGDIVENEGKFAIATDNFSAFISAREGSVKGAVDYRFIIAADIEKFATYSNPNLVLSFVKDGEVVKTATKNVLTDLDIYASATAAGKTYVALEGNLLFGLVVTDVPAEAWDTVTVTLAEGEEAFVTGSVAAADVVVDPLPGKLLGGGTWNPYTENDSATGKPVFVIWFHDNVGGANLVSKVSDGTYDATLTINGKEYSEFVTNPAGRYLVIFLEDSGIYGIKNGEKYTISFVAYDENGTRLVYSNPWEITSKVETADGPVYDYTNAIDLIAAGASSIAIEDHHSVHDKNLALAFRLADKTAWAALFGAGTPVSENGNWTPNEGYTVVVTINGEPTTFNRFSYYGFKTDNVVTDGYFRFELGAFDALTTNGISCSLAITFALIDANNKVVVYGDFGTLKYGTLVYEADTDNPGKDALVVTPVSGPDFDGGEGAKMAFDNKTTSKLCTSDRTPVIFSLAEAKALGGISLVTANDNKAYGGRIVPGFTLYGANSVDATEWTTVLAVTDAGMSGVDFTEFYYAIENATAFSHYKLVFDGTGLFQFSELWVYEK